MYKALTPHIIHMSQFDFSNLNFKFILEIKCHVDSVGVEAYYI